MRPHTDGPRAATSKPSVLRERGGVESSGGLELLARARWTSSYRPVGSIRRRAATRALVPLLRDSRAGAASRRKALERARTARRLARGHRARRRGDEADRLLLLPGQERAAHRGHLRRARRARHRPADGRAPRHAGPRASRVGPRLPRDPTGLGAAAAARRRRVADGGSDPPGAKRFLPPFFLSCAAAPGRRRAFRRATADRHGLRDAAALQPDRPLDRPRCYTLSPG